MRHILFIVFLISLSWSQNITVDTSWNLYGSTEDITNMSPFDKECVDTLWSYEDGQWKRYSYGGTKDIENIAAGMGFWIKGASSCGINTQDISSSGSAVIFSAKSSGVNTDSMNVGTTYVSWDSSSKTVLKYDTLTNSVDVVGSTVSYSYSSSYIYPLTANGKLYTISTRSGIDIQGYDPKTLLDTTQATNVYTNDTHKGYAVVGDRVFYIDSYGDLNVVHFDDPYNKELLLEKGNHTLSARSFYGVGDALISTYFENDEYLIRYHNTQTGDVERVLARVSEVYFGYFYAGDEALYWLWFDEGSKVMKVYMLDIQSLSIKQIFQMTLEETPYNLVVDDSNGKIFIGFSDGVKLGEYKPYFYIIDATTLEQELLDVDASIFSSGIFGMQFLWIDK
jgi:hypothetical protein